MRMSLRASAKQSSKRHPELVSGSKIGFLHDKTGASLMIAIVFVSFFMLVMAGLFEAILRVNSSRSNMEAESKAKYLMDSAQEIASYWAATAGVGKSFSDLDANGQKPYLDPLYALATELGVANCVPVSTATDQTKCVDIVVKGRNADTSASKVSFAGAISAYFSAPMKGTGDAATACGATTADSADDACNWNRIYVGQSVEVPLYYMETGGTVKKLFSPGSSDEFRLRVRTPLCADVGATGSACGTDGRAMLYPDPQSSSGATDYGNPEKDPVLIQWTISDLSAGGSATLLANDAVSSGKRKMVAPFRQQNTELSAGRINIARDVINLTGGVDPLSKNVVLEYVPSVIDSQLFGADLSRTPVEIGSFISLSNVTNPVLRLSLVGQPQVPGQICESGGTNCKQDVNNSNYNVPYLEYQLLVKGMPIPDSKDIVTVKVKVGDFKKEITVPLENKAGLGGFALENL